MKAWLLTFVLASLCFFATAEIGPFVSRGYGHFTGELATYAAGDTIIFVNNANTSNNPSQAGHIIFNISTDGGETWLAQEIAEVANCLTQPTLNVSPGEILISYTDGFESKLAFSSNGGSQWQIYDAGKTFENSPVVDKSGTEYRSFGLDLPFPEYRQSEFTLSSSPEEFINLQAFTEEELSMNDTPVYYWGPDVYHGMVRSNSDIMIRQGGGGENNGWPTFYAPVITSGGIFSQNGTPPYADVFRGGLIENAPRLETDPMFMANENGILVGPAEYDPNFIVMVTVDGNSYTAWLGDYSVPHREHAFVYPIYPAENLGDPAFQNTYAVADTIWTPLAPGSGGLNFYTPNKLWIRGEFSGHQSWCSADTICIIGDITLSGTTPGSAPDVEPVNTTDSVKLIAGKNVLLKYGYRDPADSTRVHPLCRADTDPISIYASIYVLGSDPQNNRKAGLFTFEYQHPHPSMPTLYGWNQYWDNIDLHRYRFPQSSAEPWPPNIDYPWYNPLWPERLPYKERGTLQWWGSVYQHRRGYFHRNLYDAEHPSNGVWDIDNDYCGATSDQNFADPVTGLQLATRNYPGATGSGVGYKKTFRYDNRFPLGTSPGLSSHPALKLGMKLSELSFTADGLVYDDYHYRQQFRKTHSKAYARNGDMALYATNDLLLKSEGDSVTDLSSLTLEDGNIQSVSIASDGSAFVYLLKDFNPNFVEIFKKITADGVVEYDGSSTSFSKLNDSVIMPDGRRIFAIYREDGNIYVSEVSPGNMDHQIDLWPLNIAPLGDPAYVLSRLYLVPSADNELEVFLWLRQGSNAEANQPGIIYHAHASFPVSINDPAVPSVQNISFSGYPNPMRDQLKLELEIPSASSHRIDIFNIRGQKINSLSDANFKGGKLEYIWNGTDNNGRQTAPGIYLIKLYVDDKPIRSKRICRI